MSHQRQLHYAVVLFLSMILAVNFHFTQANYSYERVSYLASQHFSIINHDAPSPYRYRVLVPYAAETISRLMDYPLSEGKLMLAYSMLHFLVLPAAMLALYLYVASTTNDLGGLIAAGVVFISWPLVTQVYHSYLLWAVVEMLLLSLVLLWKDRPLVCGLMIVLAMLNRETGVFVALAYFAANWREARAYAYLIMAVMIFAVLRLVLGLAPHENSNHESFQTQTIIFNMFFVPLWIAVWRGYRGATVILQRIALVGLPYIGALLLFASLREVRLLLTAYPLWLPLAVTAIQQSRTSRQY
jgi:hypothetical protein